MNKHLFQKLYSFIILLALLLFLSAFRDCNAVTIKNAYAAEKPQQITNREMKKMVADLFSIKCGIPRSVISKSEIKIYDSGDFFEVWIDHFAKPYENHKGQHVIVLSKSGELLRWYGHGMYFDEINPDVMTMGEEVMPLHSDAQVSEVMALLRSDLEEKLENEEADRYTYEAKYMKNQCFGRIYSITSPDLIKYIPVWIIYVYDQQGVLCWKAAYSNSGKRISLVPGEQDFDSYEIPGENFLHEVFENGYDIQQKMGLIIRDKDLGKQDVSEEQIDIWMKDWTPKYINWLQEHPYSFEPHMEYLLECYPQYAE